jgi:DNA-binding GntR family transcriptional regulator
VRANLEGLATELAATRMTADNIERCRQLAVEHEALGRDGKVYEMLRKNHQFHFAIYEMSGSETLPQLIAMLWLRFGPYMRLLSDLVARQLDQGIIHPYSTYHHEMIEAFRAGDAKRAGALMVADIEATQTLLRDLC